MTIKKKFKVFDMVDRAFSMTKIIKLIHFDK